MPHVAGELRRVGEDAGLVRPRDEPRRGRLTVRLRVLPANVIDRDAQHGAADERVLAQLHWPWTRMRGLTRDVDDEAVDRIAVGHDADRNRAGIELGAL